MVLTTVLGAFALLSLALTLWQVTVAVRFPLHRRVPAPDHAPAISILKPLKGCDAETGACLQSWLEQDYAAPTQILFGVDSPNDPVCALVRDLMARHPGQDAHLIICAEQLGANAKVSTLIQLHRLVRHEVLVVSDADVRVPAGFLAQVVAPLHDGGVGLVNCFYQAPHSANLAMRWEAFAINADFWSQVLQAQSLKPIDFALGAVMATSNKQLEGVGGFSALADYLADDYELGHRIARNGARVAICPVVPECRSAPLSLREVWSHQLRWARTIRVCRPAEYFFSALNNATLWPVVWLLFRPVPRVLSGAAICLLARILAALYCERKLTRRFDLNSLWLAPVKDVLQIPIWALAFAGNRVYWRGRRFRVLPGGRLTGIELTSRRSSG